MTDNDKSPRFDDPKNITVGRVRGFDRPIQPEGWILPGGRRTQDKIEAYRAAEAMNQMIGA